MSHPSAARPRAHADPIPPLCVRLVGAGVKGIGYGPGTCDKSQTALDLIIDGLDLEGCHGWMRW